MSNLPASVERFILEHVDSIQELEILMLLYARPDCDWSPESVANALKRDTASCARCLGELQRRGFAAANGPEGMRYTSRPWADASLTLVAHMYPRHWTAVVRLISSRPQSPRQA